VVTDHLLLVTPRHDADGEEKDDGEEQDDVKEVEDSFTSAADEGRSLLRSLVTVMSTVFPLF
jgi:hypothetical protein